MISFLFWVFDKEKNKKVLCSLFRRENVQVLSEKTSFIRRDAALNKHNEPPVAAHSLQQQTVKYQPAERKWLHCQSAFNEFKHHKIHKIRCRHKIDGFTVCHDSYED